MSTSEALSITIAKLSALLLIDPEALSEPAYKALREARGKIDMVICRNESNATDKAA